MCGIAGIFNLDGSEVQKESLVKMTNTIIHRGPDGEGHWVSKNRQIGFGHRRLAIIDLSSSGAQPMSYQNERFTISFNGEIYNYLELKEILISKGYKFISESDTEVLLALYAEYGKECLQKLDGMFAFAIWDEEKKELFCARDRLGEKPFFYYKTDQQFIFGSEIKEILAVVPTVKLNKEKLQQYLNDGLIDSYNQSFFQGITVLEPASYLEINSNNETHKSHYWSIKLNGEKDSRNEGEMVKDFKSLFEESIERRMRMDVGYGTSLSGGLDSSSIASVIAKKFKTQLTTFSARFKSKLDEGKWINEVTTSYNLINKTVYPEFEDMMQKLDKLSYHQEYPILGSSMFAQWSVMELVKANKTKVLIDGQGADEFLCGYKELKYFAIWDSFYRGNFKRFFRERKLFNKYFGAHERIGWGFLFYPILKLIGKMPKEWQFGTNLKSRLRHAIMFDLSNLLMSADRNSMAHSVEVRLPFTNHQLIEYTFRLPDNMLYDQGETKTILRKSMEGILPDKILRRKDKIGFAPPQQTWLKEAKGLKAIEDATKKIVEIGLKPSAQFPWRNIAVASLLKSFD